MNPTTAQDEITAYVEGVRAALVGLPETTRIELLEDLPEHLAEVLAEGQGTLVDRLGTPRSYAAELLTTAGFVGGFPEPPATTSSALLPFRQMRDDVARIWRRADTRIGPVVGYPKFSDFWALLRPGWWVLRGYLAAMAIAYLLDESDRSPGLLPRIGDSSVIALVLLGACIVGSIALGRRSTALSPWPRYALGAATVFLAIFAFAGFNTADSTARDPYATYGPSSVSSYDENPYSNVNDVYVYDRSGKLVEGARLFDQDGSEIVLGTGWCADPETGESIQTRNLGYPYCPSQAPFDSSSTSEGAKSAAPEATKSAAPGTRKPAAPRTRKSTASEATESTAPSSSPATADAEQDADSEPTASRSAN